MRTGCESCPLNGRRFVSGSGLMDAPGVVLGTSPGEREEATGTAFKGQAGNLVRSVLAALDVNVFYTNVLKRRPVDENEQQRRPRVKEIRTCSKHLTAELNTVKPKVILCLGQIPFTWVMGEGHKLDKMHGLVLPNTRLGFDTKVVGTYDPSYVLRRGGLHSRVGDSWLLDLEEFAATVRASKG